PPAERDRVVAIDVDDGVVIGLLTAGVSPTRALKLVPRVGLGVPRAIRPAVALAGGLVVRLVDEAGELGAGNERRRDLEGARDVDLVSRLIVKATRLGGRAAHHEPAGGDVDEPDT